MVDSEQVAACVMTLRWGRLRERCNTLFLVGGMAAACVACQHGKAGVEPTSEAQAEAQVSSQGDDQIPNVVRPGMRAAMGRHAEHASALTRAVALGLHEETVTHATALLDEPKLARPVEGVEGEEGILNEQLPLKLFQIDEAFRAALVDLREAASSRDDQMEVARFASVLRACRDCHRSFGTSETPPGPGQSGPRTP